VCGNIKRLLGDATLATELAVLQFDASWTEHAAPTTLRTFSLDVSIASVVCARGFLFVIEEDLPVAGRVGLLHVLRLEDGTMVQRLHTAQDDLVDICWSEASLYALDYNQGAVSILTFI
jgi:hypothetical protein